MAATAFYLSLKHVIMTCSFIFSSPSTQTVVLLLKLSPSSQLQPSLWITFQLFSNPQNLFHCFHWHHFKPLPPETEHVFDRLGLGKGGIPFILARYWKGEEKRKTPSCGLRKQYIISGLWSKKRSCQGWYIMEQRYHLENKTAARWLGVWNAKS